MVPKFYSASAPGSLMLFGEHAVLRYNQAIVCAIAQRIEVRLFPQANNNIIINSNEFPEYVTTLENIKVQQPYDYILTAILLVKSQLTQGFNLEINATFAATIGLGSSAAVTVATVAVLRQWLGLPSRKEDIFLQAKEIMLLVQGIGSGADLAASIYGGILHYNREPFAVTSLATIDDMILIYSGSKLKTKEVLKIVEQENAHYPQIFTCIFQGITACVQQAVIAIQEQNWPMLGKLLTIQHGFMQALGVSNVILDQIVSNLLEFGAFGAKISGSGLGDCVIALGKIANNSFPVNICQKQQGVRQLPVTISDIGLSYG